MHIGTELHSQTLTVGLDWKSLRGHFLISLIFLCSPNFGNSVAIVHTVEQNFSL